MSQFPFALMLLPQLKWLESHQIWEEWIHFPATRRKHWMPKWALWGCSEPLHREKIVFSTASVTCFTHAKLWHVLRGWCAVYVAHLKCRFFIHFFLKMRRFGCVPHGCALENTYSITLTTKNVWDWHHGLVTPILGRACGWFTNDKYTFRTQGKFIVNRYTHSRTSILVVGNPQGLLKKKTTQNAKQVTVPLSTVWI